MSRSPRLLAVARWWSRHELRRYVDGLRVRGLETARHLAGEQPVIFAATHVAFWDVFVLITLDEALATDGYALMDAENLCRVPLVSRLGAIPIRRDQPRAGLRQAAAMLDRPGRAVWIFPQGAPRPAHLRPLAFLPGVRMLARLAPQAALVPVALQYAYGASHHPAAYASFGRPMTAAALAEPEGIVSLEQAVEAELERIDRFLGGLTETFESLVPSAEREEGRFATRLLNRALWPGDGGRGRG